jgi:predicted adenine nucleotide alpha hydrolase (AANH) superfamily ATPase
MKRMLFHICCGPCAIYPLKEVLPGEFKLYGYFYNPNILPWDEYRKRALAVKTLAGSLGIKVAYGDGYRPGDFYDRVLNAGMALPPKEERCARCYGLRLQKTAEVARHYRFDAFSTALLYSKYQFHESIKEIGLSLAQEHGVPFYYEDFRSGWGRGIKLSKKMGLYRQKYCGCIYSMEELKSGEK